MKGTRSILLQLAIVSLILMVPFVGAVQPTTRVQIVNVGSGFAGGEEPILVTAIVYYNGSALNYTLRVGVFDVESSPAQPVPGIVATEACMTPESAVALCSIPTHSESGAEQVTFKIGGIFASEQQMPGAWKLEIIAALYDSNGNVIPNSSSRMPFEINLSAVWLQFVLPTVVGITVNGVQQPAGTSQVAVPLGQNTISAPEFAQVNETTRLRFDHWADGYDQANRTVIVQGNETLEVDYVPQYLLTISGAQQNVTGPGWYDLGTNASFSIYPYQVAPGPLGGIGVKQAFQGFYENGQLVTSQASGTIVMNGPRTLNAVWQLDYTTPAIIIAGAIIVIALGWLVVKRQRTKVGSNIRRKPRRRRVAK
ncbi:MAG TPA: hypothetical protein VLV18_10520 [Terriglobales bacterium]|nr:hypothetical protein [Terriglobales bacterium]